MESGFRSGHATFTHASNVISLVQFDQVGSYELQLSAVTDGITVIGYLVWMCSSQSEVINIDQAWLDAHGQGPYILNQPSTRYVLMTDISASGTAIQITARDITLDLNGHTITYDQIGGGVPNSGFEEMGSNPEVPFGWDLSRAPGACRESTFSRAEWSDAGT